LRNGRDTVPVYILHWNRPWECLRAVEAFSAQDLPIHITVIDNASKPDLLKILSDGLPSHVKLVCRHENLGWGRGFNALLAQWLEAKTGQYCFVSAHDALPQPKCLRMLLESMQGESNKIGIACAEYGVAHLPRYSPVLGVRLPYVEPRPLGAVEEVTFPLGTLTLFKRQCLEQIGLFDERYFGQQYS